MNHRVNRLLIVGNADPVHLGAHLLNAARSLGLNASLADTNAAFEASVWRRRFNWWLRGHRPSALGPFGEQVVQTVRDEGIDCVLTTGLAPLDVEDERAFELGLGEDHQITHFVAWKASANPSAALHSMPRSRSIAGGSDEVMRNIVGERVLGLPKDVGIDATSPFRDLKVGTQA